MESHPGRRRPVIAFFDYPDLFDDFWPRYGVSQQAFLSSSFVASGHYMFLRLLQREVADVIWYQFALKPEFAMERHSVLGCSVKMLQASPVYRLLWRAFFLPRQAWRWRWLYPRFAALASYLIMCSWRLVSALRTDRPNLIFLQDYATGRFDLLLLAAQLLGVPLVAYHTGSSPDSYLGRRLKHWTLPKADMLFPSSAAEAEMLATRYGVSPSRLEVVLTPIDTVVYRPADRVESCRGAGLDPAHRYVLFVGRLENHQKRVDALLGAFEHVAPRYPDVDMVVVGDGPAASALRKLGDERSPGRVRFMGLVTEPRLKAHLFNAAEYLVVPSRYEGFPAVVGEAMACGTPVLASRVGGIPELVVEGETGWLIEPCDDEALARRLAEVLASPDRLAEIRVRARAMAELRVSPERVAQALRRCLAQAGLAARAED
jgi:glycosyltransferase involved in cell wall biosynthesis